MTMEVNLYDSVPHDQYDPRAKPEVGVKTSVRGHVTKAFLAGFGWDVREYHNTLALYNKIRKQVAPEPPNPYFAQIQSKAQPLIEGPNPKVQAEIQELLAKANEFSARHAPTEEQEGLILEAAKKAGLADEGEPTELAREFLQKINIHPAEDKQN